MMLPRRKRKDTLLGSEIFVFGAGDIASTFNTAITTAGLTYPDDYSVDLGAFTARPPFSDKKLPGSGKWYMEFQMTDPDASNVSRLGIFNEITDNRVIGNTPGAKISILSGTNIPLVSTGITIHANVNTAPFATGDVVMMALDTDDGLLWVGKNGVWSSGDPGAGTLPNFTLVGFVTYMWGYHKHNAAHKVRIQTGAFPFNFEPPTGYHPGWYQDN